MKLLRLSALFCLAWVAVANAQDAGRLQAQDAANALAQAATMLSEAEKSSDRIAALTDTIRAYEAGLSALRHGLRDVALSERGLQARLADEDGELADLLVLLESMSKAGRSGAVLHPGGAVQNVRAGVLTAALVPALDERSKRLRSDLQELSALRAIQESGMQTLSDGLKQVRQARTSLSEAVSERTDLPAPLATDEAAMQALINSAETLSALADSLSSGEAQTAPLDAWSLPVLGEVLRGFQEPDAAGVARPGWMIGTAPEALVTAPADSTVRFSGNLSEATPATILETAPGQLVILTGYDLGFVVQGQIVSAGEPIALMGGRHAAAQENLNETILLSGQTRAETLYMEVRQGQAPVDPAAFLRPSQE